MKDAIFRMYDIRGKVGSELVISETYSLTQAIIAYLVSCNNNIKKIVVGMDGRTHSPAIKEEVCRSLIDSNIDVVFIGVCPSPVMYFALHTMDVDAGIMITASHNPKEYNGFKICIGTQSLSGQAIQDVKKLYQERVLVTSAVRGTYSELSIVNAYIADLVGRFPHLVGMNLPLVIDCGNGAAGAIVPSLVRAFKWSHAQMLYCDIDGTYPHHEADPVVEENMQDVKQVLDTSLAEVGIGFDGDGDRMAAMTKQGYLVPGDQMLAILSASYIRKHPGAALVCDIKSSSALIDVVARWGGTAFLSPSGHSLIKKSMREHGAKIGGELSGHFFFYDTYFGYDDGIYAALRLLSLMVESGMTLDEYVAQLPHKVSSPEYRIACEESHKQKIVHAVETMLAQRSDVNMVTIDGVRATITDGLGIVRASNTQPVISVRFEADTKDKLYRVKKIFMQAMVPYIDENVLEQHMIQE